ncbi:MAG TPA: heme exporter protein CcmB [bacterium]|nr:heme exporter protein CcmB [bacterium]
MSAFVLLLHKDLRLEARGRDLLPSMAVLALLLLALGGAAGLGGEAAPAVLWITVAVTAAGGLARSFHQETDQDQLLALRLAAVDPAVIYLAKAAANFVVVGVVELLALAALAVFFNVRLPAQPLAFAAVLLLGTASLVGLGTLLGGMLAAARAREALMPVLLLPLAAPAVMAATGATARLMSGGGSVSAELGLLLAFAAVSVAAAVLVFEHVVEE